MDEQAVRKTYQYKLKPTPQQERAMALVVRRGRERSNAALQKRRDAWHTRGVSLTLHGGSSPMDSQDTHMAPHHVDS
jgi:hypothetical protein